MRIIETKVYRFKELDEQAKEKAIENNRETFVEDTWWEFIEYDLEFFGLKLVEFDLGRRDYVKLEMYRNLDKICNKIIENCGDTTEIYKIAVRYSKEYKLIQDDMESLNDMDTDKDEHDLMNLLHKSEDLEDEFLKEISEEALSMLKNDYEYLTSRESIIEMFEANEYEFTEEGKLI